MVEDTETYGHEQLRKWRKRRHLKQPDLAERLGVNEKTYGDYERGKRVPKRGMVNTLASELDIPPEVLLDPPWSPSDQRLLASNSFAA